MKEEILTYTQDIASSTTWPNVRIYLRWSPEKNTWGQVHKARHIKIDCFQPPCPLFTRNFKKHIHNTHLLPAALASYLTYFKFVVCNLLAAFAGLSARLRASSTLLVTCGDLWLLCSPYFRVVLYLGCPLKQELSSPGSIRIQFSKYAMGQTLLCSQPRDPLRQFRRMNHLNRTHQWNFTSSRWHLLKVFEVRKFHYQNCFGSNTINRKLRETTGPAAKWTWHVVITRGGKKARSWQKYMYNIYNHVYTVYANANITYKIL